MSTQLNDELIEEVGTYFLTNHEWESFTPTVTQSGAVAATVTFARYIVLADTVIVQARLAITGAGTGGNDIVISGFPTNILPINTQVITHVVGNGILRDTGTVLYQGAMVYAAGAANTFKFVISGNTGFAGSTPNFALANGDFIGFQCAYER